LQALFERASDLDPAERAAWLDSACAGDDALRRELEQLLLASTSDDGRLERMIGSAVRRVEDIAAGIGRRIGQYRITGVLGEGGMGGVYRAARADGAFEHEVAVKLLSANRAVGEARRRFRSEQQILANLHHPNIAPLLDGGTTEDGVPYLVMEYIDGRPIDVYCDEHALPVDARLRLFRDVCAAVSYAHRNLVVHRDIKPSNILVTAEGGVRLLDFGIAKLLDAPLDGPAVAQTRAEMRLLTPAYASPEQVRGGVVTTASDVYALGVLLCQLLGGALPYSFPDGRAGAIERVICEQDPRPPSAGCLEPRAERSAEEIAAQRSTTPRRLQRALAGDLDTIVLMALRKDPQRRYGSVQELSDDVARHLDGMPIRARADSRRYRAAKFIVRHRFGVAVAATFFFMLAAVAITMTVQARRIATERDVAEQERARAEELAGLVERVFTASDPRREPRPDVTVRELLDTGVRGVEAELVDQPLVLARLLRTIGTAYLNLGELEVAEHRLEQAVDLSRANLPPVHEDLAASLTKLADAKFANDEAIEAERLHGEALAMYRQTLPADDPRIAAVLNARGSVRQHLEKLDEAAADYEEALRIYRASESPRSADVAAVLSNLAQISHTRGDYEEAEARYREVLDIAHATLSSADPALGDYAYNLAVLLDERGRYDEAEVLYGEALTNNRAAFGNDHPEVATVLVALGRLYRDRGELDRARTVLEQAREIVRKRYGEQHTEYAYHTVSLAVLLKDQGELQAAQSMLEQAIATYRQRLPHAHAWLAGALRVLGETLTLEGRPAEAEAPLREALEIWEDVRDVEHWRVGETLSALGEALLVQGRVAEAEAPLSRGYELLRAEFGEQGRRTCIAARRLDDWYAATASPEPRRSLACVDAR
jgi:serine/threonine protein kinase/tetratricopeptide (TPR) repeat protein